MAQASSGYAQGPVQVVVVDAEDDAAALPAARADGGSWIGAWLVVRSGGVPLGMVEVAHRGRDEVPADEVAALVDGVLATSDRRSLPVVPDDELPSISVVVPSDLRRPDHLRTTLEGLDALDHPDFEVVLVDNSRTGTVDVAALVAGLDRVRVVREPVPGISAARNAGVRAARGAVIAFTDDDVQADRSWLRALTTRFALRPDEDVVTGVILPAELETDAQLWFERYYGGFGGARTFEALTYRGAGKDLPPARRARVVVEDWHGKRLRDFVVYGAGVAGAGANMAFRAETLRAAGGFDLALGTGTPARGGEDLAMLMGVLWNGGAIGYEPAAQVFHTHRADYPALRKQVHGYGLGFTATLTALVLDDPRHVVALASQLPKIVRAVLPWPDGAADTGTAVPGTTPLGPPPPAELDRLNRRGGLQGPYAYLRSRRAMRTAVPDARR